MNYFNQESNRLIYRKLTESDIPLWTEFFIDNNLLHFLGLDMSKSHLELATGWITRQFQRYEEEGLGHLAVIEKASGKLIGMTGIIPRELDGNSYFEIAYSFIPINWGKGFASEASQQMKKFGFENKISPQFISIIDLENYASQNVARKNNMEIIFNSTYEGMEVFIFGTGNLK
jgi:RimJ/RimL family protein N-acetyltransferase